MTGHLLCFGYGFSARHLVPLLLTEGWTVSATTRSENVPKGDGINFIQFDAVLDSHLSKASHVLLSAPPGRAEIPFCIDITTFCPGRHISNGLVTYLRPAYMEILQGRG